MSFDPNEIPMTTLVWLKLRMDLSIKLHLYVSGFVPISIILSLVAYGLDEPAHGHAFMLAATVIVFGMMLLDYSIIRSIRKIES
jgi:hypothetical protein